MLSNDALVISFLSTSANLPLGKNKYHNGIKTSAFIEG